MTKEYKKICKGTRNLYCCLNNGDDNCEECTDYKMYKKGFSEGYAQGEQDLMASDTVINKLEEELYQLKEQIKKMKCCGNCKYYGLYVSYDTPCYSCNSKNDKWELAE